MELFGSNWLSILATGFFVGTIVGLTGMGGGALMTPALIFLGVGDPSTVVTADLTPPRSTSPAARPFTGARARPT